MKDRAQDAVVFLGWSRVMTKAQRYLLALSCLLISMQVAQAQSTKTGYPGYLNRSRVHGFVPKHEKMQRAGSVAKRQQPASQPMPNPFDKPIQVVADPFAAPISAVLSEAESIAPASYIDPIALQPRSPFSQTSCDCNSCSSYTMPAPCSSHSPCYRPMFWISAEYLSWWTRSAHAPALATASPAGTDRDIAGVLGEAGTSTLFGNSDFHSGSRNGGRFTGGMWLSRARSVGIEVRYTSIETDTDEFLASQTDFDILARPFFNTQLIEEDSRLINFADVVEGDLSIRATSDFDTLEVTMLRCVGDQSGISNFLYGYRNMNLDESIRIDESTTSLAAPTLDSTTDLFDQFGVENTFHGGQIGVHYVTEVSPCWTFDFLGKASLGNTRSRVRINGQTTTTVPNAPPDISTVDGGLLALGSNIGSSADSEFSAVFEVGMNFRRSFQNGLHFKIGYTFLHWGNVLRAVEQIDPTINPTQIPPDTLVGLERPTLEYNRSSFWAQGLNLGLEYQF